MKRRPTPPLPLTAGIWRELARNHGPRVRGLIVDGKPCIIITRTPRREA